MATSKSVLTIFLLHPHWFLHTSQIKSFTFCKLWSCSNKAPGSTQSSCPGLLTYSGTFSWQCHVWLSQLIQNSNPTETAETRWNIRAITVITKSMTTECRPTIIKRVAMGERESKWTNLGGFCCSSGIHSCIGLCGCSASRCADSRSARAAEGSKSWGNQLEGKRGNGSGGIKKERGKEKRFVELNSNKKGTEELPSPFRIATLSLLQNLGPSGTF